GLGQEPEAEQLDRQLCSLVVLGRPELVGGAGWIDLCLKAQRDPGDLARKYEDALMGNIVESTSINQEVRSFVLPLRKPRTCIKGGFGRELICDPFSRRMRNKRLTTQPLSLHLLRLPQ
ncbi:hypothetical protein IMZ48_47620, partial [Candidatus Bathyarchaeota archaeon]|nr:hypothetical protein [Candidatus Bathyarchaeota archaeon]